MSFNNPLAFNLSKSSATTSTTNTNMIQVSPASGPTSNTGSATEASSPVPKSPFLQNMLVRNSASSLDTKDSITKLGAVSSGVASTKVTKDETVSVQKLDKSDGNLIGLFEKFDINKGSSAGKSEEPEAEEEKDEDVYEKKYGNEANVADSDPGVDQVVDEKEAVTREMVEKPGVIITSRPFTVGLQMSMQPYDPFSSTPTPVLEAIDTNVAQAAFVQSSHTEGSLEQDLSSESVPVKSVEVSRDVDNSQVNAKSSQETSAATEGTSGSIPTQETSRPTSTQETNTSTPTQETSTSAVKQVTRAISRQDTTNVAPKVKDTIDKDDKDLSDLTGAGEIGSVEEFVGETNNTPEDESEYHHQSHKPFDFQNFLVHLRKKSADPIVRYIRSFLVSFTRKAHTFTVEQRIKIVKDFKTFMNDKFLIYQPFASMDDIDLENSREGLEKLIMNRIYENCFPPEVIKQVSTQSYLPEPFRLDLQKDAEFALQLEKYSWINGSHLDIDLAQFSYDSKGDLIDYSITELNKINSYRAPRDKIICILNSCKIIFSFLKVSNQETNADSFIPLVILVLIKAKTDHLISNLNYIENYRGDEWLSHGETSYYLSSLQAAINFIRDISINELTMNAEEYNAHMEAWDAEQKQRQQRDSISTQLLQPQPQHINQTRQTPQEPQSLSPSNVLFTSAELFTKSISSFLSPSPGQSSSDPRPIDVAGPVPVDISGPRPVEAPGPVPTTIAPAHEAVDEARIKETYNNLKEIFPQLDKSLLNDISIMNKGSLDESLDACLQLVNDV